MSSKDLPTRCDHVSPLGECLKRARLSRSTFKHPRCILNSWVALRSAWSSPMLVVRAAYCGLQSIPSNKKSSLAIGGMGFAWRPPPSKSAICRASSPYWQMPSVTLQLILVQDQTPRTEDRCAACDTGFGRRWPGSWPSHRHLLETMPAHDVFTVHWGVGRRSIATAAPGEGRPTDRVQLARTAASLSQQSMMIAASRRSSNPAPAQVLSSARRSTSVSTGGGSSGTWGLFMLIIGEWSVSRSSTAHLKNC